MPLSEPPFQPGDQLRVRRRGYWHHGIFIREDRVIEFGGRILDKPNATIRSVPFDAFANGGIVERVEHGEQRRLLWMSVMDFPDLPADQVIDRAEWLVSQQFSRGLYQLIGANCEHVANWCKTGAAESYQSRSTFAPFGTVALFGMLVLNKHPDVLRRLRPYVYGVSVAGIFGPILYNLGAKKIYSVLRRYPGIGKWDR
jgi:hypothetical protein